MATLALLTAAAVLSAALLAVDVVYLVITDRRGA